MNTQELHAARANLNAALQEEGQALAIACLAANAGGATSDQAVQALRSAEAAHARSNTAAGELRALSARLDRVNAVAELSAGPHQALTTCLGGAATAPAHGRRTDLLQLAPSGGALLRGHQ